MMSQPKSSHRLVRDPFERLRALGDEPIYCEADPAEVLCEGSDDEKYSSSGLRRWRYEVAALRFLDEKPPRLLSASLRGPFDAVTGWKNPWGSRQSKAAPKTAPSAKTTRPIHHRQNPRALAPKKSKSCHLPSPQSLDPVEEVQHQYLGDVERASISDWISSLCPEDPASDNFWAPVPQQPSSQRKRRAEGSAWLKRQGGKRRKVTNGVNKPADLSLQTQAASSLPVTRHRRGELTTNEGDADELGGDVSKCFESPDSFQTPTRRLSTLRKPAISPVEAREDSESDDEISRPNESASKPRIWRAASNRSLISGGRKSSVAQNTPSRRFVRLGTATPARKSHASAQNKEIEDFETQQDNSFLFRAKTRNNKSVKQPVELAEASSPLTSLPDDISDFTSLGTREEDALESQGPTYPIDDQHSFGATGQIEERHINSAAPEGTQTKTPSKNHANADDESTMLPLSAASSVAAQEPVTPKKASASFRHPGGEAAGEGPENVGNSSANISERDVAPTDNTISRVQDACVDDTMMTAATPIDAQHLDLGQQLAQQTETNDTPHDAMAIDTSDHGLNYTGQQSDSSIPPTERPKQLTAFENAQSYTAAAEDESAEAQNPSLESPSPPLSSPEQQLHAEFLVAQSQVETATILQPAEGNTAPLHCPVPDDHQEGSQEPPFVALLDATEARTPGSRATSPEAQSPWTENFDYMREAAQQALSLSSPQATGDLASSDNRATKEICALFNAPVAGDAVFEDALASCSAPSTPRKSNTDIKTTAVLTLKAFADFKSPSSSPRRRSRARISSGRLPNTQSILRETECNPWATSRPKKRVSWAPLPETPRAATDENASDDSPTVSSGGRAASPPPPQALADLPTGETDEYRQHFSAVKRNAKGLKHRILPTASQQVLRSPSPMAMAEAFVAADNISKGYSAGQSPRQATQPSRAPNNGCEESTVFSSGGIFSQEQDEVDDVLMHLGDFLNVMDVDADIEQAKTNQLNSAHSEAGKENVDPFSPVEGLRSVWDSFV